MHVLLAYYSALGSGSTFLIVSPSQTVANVVILMIAVLPQTGQRHLSANGAADEGQSQWASGCFIGGTVLWRPNSWAASPSKALADLRSMRSVKSR